MMYVAYFIAAVIWIILALFQFLYGWVLIAPFVKSDGNLRQPWKMIFQPDDSLATGDFADSKFRYQDREGAFANKYPTWLRNYVHAVMWGCRNPAYGWLSNICGIKVTHEPEDFKVIGNPEVDIGDFGATFGYCFRTCTINLVDYFDFKYVGKWSNKYGYMVRFGWNLKDIKVGEVKNLYVDVRPRIKIVSV